MITYLINLERATERLDSCIDEFNKIDLRFKLFRAVDGKTITLPNKDFCELSYNLLNGKRKNLGEIGCYFSHLNVLKDFIESGENLALVCEDDISLNKDLKKIIESAINSNIKFDLLRLSGGNRPEHEPGNPIKLKKIYDDYYLSMFFTFKHGTGSYLITKKGAKAVLKKISKMYLPIDHALDRDWITGIRSLGIVPSPVQLKKELHQDNSYINSNNIYKFKPIYRYWILIPYRIANELLRTFYKITLFLKIKILSWQESKYSSSSLPMANIQSAKKRARQANSRNSLKSSQRATIRTMIKNVEEAIGENDATKAKELLISTQKVLDKLANKKVLPKNTVARQKSRLSKSIKKLG